MTSSKIRGFTLANLVGHGIWMGTTWDTGGSTAGIELDDLVIALAGTSGGAPIWMDNNTIGVWGNHLTLAGAQNGLSVIMVPMTAYGGNDSCCMYFDNITSLYHGIRVDYPSGNLTGGKTGSIFIRNWLSEDLVFTDLGFILNDSGPNAPGSGAAGINGIVIENVNNADPIGGPSADGLIGELGISGNITVPSLAAMNAGGFGPYVKCRSASSLCNNPPPGPGLNINGARGGSWGGDFTTGNIWNGFSAAFSSVTFGFPIQSTLNPSAYNSNPSVPSWVQMLPPITGFSVTSTGAGSLSAGTYCMKMVGIDAQAAPATPGQTLPSNEVCQTVGALSSIVVAFAGGNAGSLNAAYSGFRLYYGTGGAGSEANYVSVPAYNPGGSDSYTFTSTSGNVAATPPNIPNAYMSWLFWDSNAQRSGSGCIYCANGGGGSGGINSWQLGVGDPAPPSGAKFSVKGGAVDSATSGYECPETAAPAGIAAFDQFWCDSTAHRWKMINNNGTATNVVGISDLSSPTIANSSNKVFVTSDFTDSTSGTLTAITGLSWTFPANAAVNASFHCSLLYDQATAAVSDSFGIASTPTAATQINASGTAYTSTSSQTTGTLTGLNTTTPTAIVTFTPSAITTIWKAELDGTIEEPSNATAPVVKVYVSTTTGADNIIVKRGSYCTLF
jgi:hypothetical protein